jgi:fructokinase
VTHREQLVGGVELGGSKVVCAVGSGAADVRAEAVIPTSTPAETIAGAIAFFRAQGAIRALGIAAFGPLDLDPISPTLGSITDTPKSGWSRTDVAGPFRRALGVPVGIDTDVNGAALGEHRWGATRDVATSVYVTVGTGIGGGGLVDGRPLHGLVHPEMGHLRVPHERRTDPFAGVCPFHGDCLEGLATGPAIAARWHAPPESLPPDHPAWPLEARYLALGLVNVIAVISPQRVVIGGGVMRQPRLLPLIRADVMGLLGGYAPSRAIGDIDRYLVAPSLGERSGVLGALALAHDAMTTPA